MKGSAGKPRGRSLLPLLSRDLSTKASFSIALIENSDKKPSDHSRIFGGHVRYLPNDKFVDYLAHSIAGHTNYIVLAWVPLS
jgi:hypothetical protein